MQNLRVQLLLSHLVLIVLMAFVMGGAVISFFRLGGAIDRILRDNYQSVSAAQEMKQALARHDSAASFYLAGETTKARTQFGESRAKFDKAYQIEINNITERGEQTVADALGRDYGMYEKNLENLIYARPSLSAKNARTAYFRALEPLSRRLQGEAQQILDINEEAMLQADQRARTEAERDTIIGVGVTLGALLVGLLTAVRMVNTALLPLVGVARQAEAIGAGQLNQRIDLRRSDEIGVLARAFNDMSEKLSAARRAEEIRLRIAERMSDAALENLYDPVVVADAQARVVHLNRAAEGLFGPAERERGRDVRAVVGEERLAGALERAVAGEHSAEEGETALIRFAGDKGARTYRLRASPMHGEDNAHIGAVAVLEDVTYQQEVDRLKTEFIGVASHELRTPVTSLLLSAQLLLEGAAGSLSDGQTEIVRAQQIDLERLDTMMRDLLDVTRLEAGAMPPRFEMVAPGDLLEAARRTVVLQAAAKGIRLTARFAHDVPLVRADRGQINRVLLNLLNNALRHTPDLGSVTLHAERADDNLVRFSVADTGSGIAPEYLTHIFERFVQVPGATRGGAGLGLSLAQTMVRAHGGELWAESEVGKGSTFHFTLPLAGKNEEK